MVISSNRRHFVTPTPFTPTGRLRTIGNEFGDGANEKFLGFKPASVCKKAGFLRITGSGIYMAPYTDLTVMLHIEFNRPGAHIFTMQVLTHKTKIADHHYFTFRADIPVGTQGTPYTEMAYVTSNINEHSYMFRPGAYITADPDDVWVAELKYSIYCDEPPVSYGDIKVTSIVTEYLEN